MTERPDELASYLKFANETTDEILTEGGPLIEALQEIVEFLAVEGWTVLPRAKPIPVLLAMNSFMLFLAGTRLALSGHTAAIFSVLRTSLESACYAYLISNDEELEQIWQARERGPDELKACRGRFNGAVKEVAVALNAEHDGSANFIYEAYEASISFGAHPNARSVFMNARLRKSKDETALHLVGLHGAESPETLRAVVACLDFGTALAHVIRRCVGPLEDATIEHLNRLEELKARAVASVTETQV